MPRYFFALAAIILPSPLPGQAGSDSRAVTGTVVDSVSQRPVANATLYFPGEQTDYRTGEDGSFLIGNIAARDTLLVVRMIGYVPALVRLPASASPLIDLGAILLRPIATELDRIIVEREEIRLHPYLAAFYERRRKGMGTFITREDIERLSARALSRMVRQARGVYVDCPPGTTGMLECTAYSNRGRDVRFYSGASGSQVPEEPVLGGEPGEQTATGWSFDRCPMDVWVDGRRSTLGLDEIDITSVAAVEVYAGPGVTPAIFGKGRCGVIAIWTRQGR